MRIGIDVQGGDNAPDAIIDGVKRACSNDDVSEYVLYCNTDKMLAKYLSGTDLPKNVEFVNCTEKIESDDEPVKAIRRKKDSAIVKGCTDLKDGKLDVFLSAGNTGAILAAGTLISGRINGVRRPALTTVYPAKDKMIVLLDVGANAECTSENMNQFSIMGSLYSEKILSTTNPSVGLVNIGVEKTKGTPLYQETHSLMQDNQYINFIGNVEARDIPNGVADVVVADGFTGNIILKTTEGIAISLFEKLKEAFYSSLSSKMGAMLSKKSLKAMKKGMDYSEYGGAPLLGLKYPIVKAHGSSNGQAIESAILYAKKYASSDLIATLESRINQG